MLAERYFKPVQYPGVEPGKGISTTYGFNLVVNARAPKDKQEALHDLYKFIMSDLIDCWKDTAPFSLARKSGWADNPAVKEFPDVAEIIKAKDQGVFLPRTVVYTELADADAPRRAEDHAQQRRHQGDARRGGGRSGPRLGGLQEGMTSSVRAVAKRDGKRCPAPTR